MGVFQILSPLGSGGMRQVYLAHDSKLGRTEGLTDRVLGRRGAAGAFQARGTYSGIAKPSEHRGDLWIGGVRRSGLPDTRVGGRQTLRGPLPIDKALEYARQI